VWLASELMFFGGLFASYFTIRAANAGNWPPRGARLDTVQAGIFTAVLVLSSGTMQLAVRRAEEGARRVARWWIVATITLGVLFLGNQAVEWSRVPFSPSTHVFGSLFFLMTGFHGFHVFLGLVAMGFLLLRMTGTSGDPAEKPAVEVVGYYWHFVDVVWLALYSTLFLLK
jgi:cytochrome c oxidase subunit III